MIDLTPLDVRKKKGDFARTLRGYDPAVVDQFLELVADRMEELVRDNTTLRDRSAQVSETLGSYREREQALNEALVTAQQLREEVRAQAAREAELLVREARAEAERLVAEGRRDAAAIADSARRLQAQRARYLRTFRSMVERQLEELEVEEERLRDGGRPEGGGEGGERPELAPDPERLEERLPGRDAT